MGINKCIFECLRGSIFKKLFSLCFLENENKIKFPRINLHVGSQTTIRYIQYV